MSSIPQRVRGVIYGTIAGDKNHGPQAMMLLIGKVLTQQAKSEILVPSFRFDLMKALIFSEYLNWYHGKGSGWYDTGQIGLSIFKKFKPDQFNTDLLQDETYLKESVHNIEQAVEQLDDKLSGQTGGINPAHRNVIFSTFKYLDLDNLMKAAQYETQLTHYSFYAVEVSQLHNYLCRKFIENGSDAFTITELCSEFLTKYEVTGELENCIKELIENQNFLSGDKHESLRVKMRLSNGGFSPQTMMTALYFLILHTQVLKYSSTTDLVTSCLMDSFEFAGSANYCPVLVGPILGAMFGDQVFGIGDLEDGLVSHSRQLPLAKLISKSLSDDWE